MDNERTACISIGGDEYVLLLQRQQRKLQDDMVVLKT